MMPRNDPINWAHFLRRHDMRFEALPPCWREAPRIRPGLVGEVEVCGDRSLALTELKPGPYELDLKKGEKALLWNGGAAPGVPTATVATVF